MIRHPLILSWMPENVTLLNVLPVEHLYIRQNVDFSTFERLMNDGKGNCTLSICQKHQQGTKLDCAKITNCSYSSYSYSRENSLFHKNSLSHASRLMARLHSLFCFGSRRKR